MNDSCGASSFERFPEWVDRHRYLLDRLKELALEKGLGLLWGEAEERRCIAQDWLDACRGGRRMPWDDPEQAWMLFEGLTDEEIGVVLEGEIARIGEMEGTEPPAGETTPQEPGRQVITGSVIDRLEQRVQNPADERGETERKGGDP